MRYTKDFVIPSNSLYTNPYRETIRLEVGVITQFIIRFRNGCHYRVAIQILDSLYQLCPASPGEGLYGNDDTFIIPMDYPINTQPFELILLGWSDGTVFDHNITIMIDVQEPQLDQPGFTLAQLLTAGGV